MDVVIYKLLHLNEIVFMNIIPIIISLVPTIILLSLVIYADRESPEPKRWITACLFGGALLVIVAYYLEDILYSYTAILYQYDKLKIASNSGIMFVVGLLEESLKYFLLVLFIFRNKYFDDPYDGIIYSAYIAIGFAGLENISYVINGNSILDSTLLTISRSLTSFPLHLTTGIIMGYYHSEFLFSKKKIKKEKAYLAILLPAIIHGIYNSIFINLSIIRGLTNDYVFRGLLLLSLCLVASLYIISIVLVKRSQTINKIFVSNGKYPSKYNYLITKNYFLNNKYGKI